MAVTTIQSNYEVAAIYYKIYGVRKVTKSQCYNEISKNNQLIKKYQNEIKTLNKEINELKETYKKISALQKTLSTCKSASVNRMSNTCTVMKINCKIVNKFSNSMHTLLAGAEYIATNNGLTKSMTKVNDEIAKRQKKIRELDKSIADCNRKNTNMDKEIKKIEKEEKKKEEEKRNAENGSN